MITVEIEGANELAAALEREPEIARPILEKATRMALIDLVDPLTTYPAPPSGSRYKRTGDLGRLWTAAPPEVHVMGTGFEGVLGNARPGAGYVQGDEQAGVHQGRWQTVRQVAEDNQSLIQARYEAAAREIAGAIDRAA
jgi:hypothetical protein